MIEKLKKVEDLNILIVGDIILDKYIYGSTERISPEAPVPVVLEEKIIHILGGASNVAANLIDLGANVSLMGYIGSDASGEVIKRLLSEKSIDFSSLNVLARPTTTKTRIVSKGQQLVRLDSENTEEISTNLENLLFEKIKEKITSGVFDGIILQDYNKGLFTAHLIQRIIQLSQQNELPVFVDPKFKNFWQYKGVSLFKPNLKEIIDANQGRFGSDLEEILVNSAEHLNCELLFCTMAEKGIGYVDDAEFYLEPTEKIDVVDVSGAGDTALAVMTMAHLIGCTPREIAKLANLGGKLVCLKSGVSTITLNELKDAYLRLNE